MIHHIAMIISSEECLEFYKALGFEDLSGRRGSRMLSYSCWDREPNSKYSLIRDIRRDRSQNRLVSGTSL